MWWDSPPSGTLVSSPCPSVFVCCLLGEKLPSVSARPSSRSSPNFPLGPCDCSPPVPPRATSALQLNLD